MAKKGLVVLLINFKGGVGKSTIADMLANRLSNSILLNIDIAQDAESVNSSQTINIATVLTSEYTPEEIENQKLSIEILDMLKDAHDYIILDTPGEQTKELIDILSEAKEYIDYIIVPTMPGKRTRNTTFTTISTLFDSDLLTEQHKLFYVVNQYNSDNIVENEITEIKKFMNETLKIPVEYSFSKLKNSDAVITMEDSQKSISELKGECYIAYAAFEKRVNSLISDFKTFIGDLS